MIPKIFTVYCAMILMAFTAAGYKGYSVMSLFSTMEKASKSASHYHK